MRSSSRSQADDGMSETCISSKEGNRTRLQPLSIVEPIFLACRNIINKVSKKMMLTTLLSKRE